MKTLHLFQYGKGHIGAALFRQIAGQTETLARRYGVVLKYAGLCGQSRVVIAPSGLNGAGHTTPEQILVEHPASQPYSGPAETLERLFELNLPGLCLVDTTAAELTDVHVAGLRRGASVVTANKKPVAADYPVYEEMQRLGRGETLRYWYETTAGAGLPILSTIRELVATGDSVIEMTGCLSGTLGYICSQLDTGRMFSDIVHEAKALGYTEPDPRDDLNGMDVARKALILARESGYTADLRDVAVESMVSPDLGRAATPDEFMARLIEEDDGYARRLDTCRTQGHVLRYMAVVRDGTIQVGLNSVPKDSPAGSLWGPDNLVTLSTTRYAGRPMVIRGPGAGAEVTAAGLFGDLIKAATARCS